MHCMCSLVNIYKEVMLLLVFVVDNDYLKTFSVVLFLFKSEVKKQCTEKYLLQWESIFVNFNVCVGRM